MIARWGNPTSTSTGYHRNHVEDIKDFLSLGQPVDNAVLEDLQDLVNGVEDINLNNLGEKKVDNQETKNTVILVTGSTGEVGRYLLHTMANSPHFSKVYAVIRAKSEEEGRERIRLAWKDIGLPQTDEILKKMVPLCIDFSEPLMGMDEDTYDRLSEEVDAVYHAGYSSNMRSNYGEIRLINVVPLFQIINFCANVKTKELHFISSLAQFPSFISFFTKEYRNDAIAETCMPSYDTMLATFDPNVIGFPWTTWVGEHIMRRAKLKGLPVTIYRTGFVWGSFNGHAALPSVGGAIMINMVNKGLIPSLNNSTYVAFVMADTLCDIILKLATVPERKHWIYNVIDPEFRNWSQVSAWAKRICLALKEVDHDTFIEAVADSPSMKPFIEVLSTWKDYWFSNTAPSEVPIRVLNLVEDLGYVYRFPNYPRIYTATFKFLDNNHMFDAHARGAIHNIHHIVMDAKALAGVPEDFSLGAKTQFYMEPIMLLQVDYPNRSLFVKLLMMLMVRTFITNMFLMIKMEKLRPEISMEKIIAPVFIVGMNRSGTTFMQNMLSADKRNRTARYLEMFTPYGYDGSYTLTGQQNKDYDWKSDSRYEFAAEMLENEVGDDEEWRGIHIQGADLCEEEYLIMEQAGRCYTILVPSFIEKYERFLFDDDCRQMKAAYPHHKRFLQHLQHQVRGDRWVLKMPFHLFCLDALFEVYPDAKVVFLHRDLDDCMSSWCSLVKKTQSMLKQGDNYMIGEHELESMGIMMDRAVMFRSSKECDNRRFLDLSYDKLIDEPMDVVKSVYDFMNVDLNDNCRQEIEHYIKKVFKERQDIALHKHNLQDFGLDSQKVQERFKNYLDFMKDKSVLFS